MSTFEELKALKQRHSAQLWKNPAVCGIDVGNDAQGKPVFNVLLRVAEPEARQGLPEKIEGHQVHYHYGPIEKQ